jgi:predicted dehydrogenase
VMTLSVAVVGAGMMGTNHARVLAGLPSAELRLVIDREEAEARRVARQFGCRWSTKISALDGAVDAAVVATPTDNHRHVALAVLDLGLDVLVEKPLAATPMEAQEIRDAADKAGRVLAVGHVERFNPACLDLTRFVRDPLFIQARRISPFTNRVVEGVVRDMMIHDIDIVLWLAGDSAVRRVSANLSAMRSKTEDLATATLVFESGLVAQLTAARIGQDKVRRIDVIQRDSVVNVDLLRQDLIIRRRAEPEFPSDGLRRFREASVREIPYLDHRGEPLLLELTDFVAAVSEGRPPLVDGSAGVAALELCDRILAAGRFES